MRSELFFISGNVKQTLATQGNQFQFSKHKIVKPKTIKILIFCKMSKLLKRNDWQIEHRYRYAERNHQRELLFCLQTNGPVRNSEHEFGNRSSLT